jgi:hypothetical protein
MVGREGIQTCNLRFIRRDSQPIELLLDDHQVPFDGNKNLVVTIRDKVRTILPCINMTFYVLYHHISKIKF